MMRLNWWARGRPIDSRLIANQPEENPVPKPQAAVQPRTTVTVVTGAWGIWTADANGNAIGYGSGRPPDPTKTEAIDIYFGPLDPTTPPPKDQSELQAGIAQVLTTLQLLYISPTGEQSPQFRIYYTRLFRLAQLGLEGAAAPEIAKSALDRVTADLIDAEGGKVKNRHLESLGVRALGLAALFIVAYVAICTLGKSQLVVDLNIDQPVAASFMLLWIGCFAGVWLSYSLRTTTLTLRDLVITDVDRLLPLTRLLFAGLLTMALGLMLALGLVDAKIGGEGLDSFIREPTKALLLGMVCGISELLLPTAVGKRATDLFSKLG
jgi:hypothetical protein